MLSPLIKAIFGSKNDRQLKRMGKMVKTINALEDGLAQLTDDQLRAKTDEFRIRINKGETLEHLMPEAFAVCREASKRVMGMRHFDVQLLGGIALHQGRIAEMRTGEGKTLVATLPAYLNALLGKGVHVITVNDYLATRDAHWMRPLYEYLGMTVGVVVPRQKEKDKQAAYQSDITYGTNNEYGFDFLRDNMAFRVEDKFQRPLNFAIVDEVDSILIDEARTPLIISGPVEDSSELYLRINGLIPALKRHDEEGDEQGHYQVDEKTRQAELTEDGHQFIEDLLDREGLLPKGESLYASSNLNLLCHVNSALKAHVIFRKNVDYIVRGDDIVLVDEHTGRTMQGRRLSEGLHQALEAKENVSIQAESQTLALTTFQNYFRLYETLSGMTGTADTEAYEFRQIYGLDVVVIPTNQPMIRNDLNDLVFLTIQEKYDAIIEDVKNAVKKGQPILVGTASIESSELLSDALEKENIVHRVLNAKYHDKEAEIIAQAGRPGIVTVATNMAGRGTDIVLGGNCEAEIDALDNPTPEDIENVKAEWQKRHQQVLDSGGLHIIGTERHESRRIDNQLRGRAGRQGDPGISRFYLSLEDNLMRIFASERVKSFMKAMGMEKGESIEHRMVTNAIEKAQKKVEGRNFDIRKQLLEYDDVANDQRKVVYSQRDEFLEADNVTESIINIRAEVVAQIVSEYIPYESLEEQWDVPGLESRIELEFFEKLPIGEWLDTEDDLNEEGLRQRILEKVIAAYQKKEDMAGSESLKMLEKHILLRILDDKWKEHLTTMDHLRQGIHLRGFAAKNPKQEYKREAFALFQQMLTNIKHEVIRTLSHVQVQENDQEAERHRREEMAHKMQFQHEQIAELGSSMGSDEPQAVTQPPVQPFVRDGKKIGRNDACPCGSGKKYKQCHGKII
ncbi:MAG: preprotein translocase subunit SecA [Endozoicomonadaceae bacterium]|nr:preprotein translocase subunit SecA [Endozoicomonadaceae bacterium]